MQLFSDRANHDINLLLSGKYPQRLKERILSSHGHLSNKDCGQLLATYGTADFTTCFGYVI